VFTARDELDPYVIQVSVRLSSEKAPPPPPDRWSVLINTIRSGHEEQEQFDTKTTD
jgi:hypothetical protein